MNPQRWKQVKEILNEVAERAPEDRHSFLQGACRNDTALLREVESLLEYEESAADFMEESAVEVTARLAAEEELHALRGQRVGQYEIVRELGCGGMGAVYLAERVDEEYRGEVAIKLIKRGMDTEYILRRFRHERQILASLNHPNIARLLDGGATPDGLPYFVMEYIEGLPITEYADRHELSTTDRLRLFRTVCAAVSYAHRNLVVHRDLKPSNILVTAEGTPKLLDFGIAKLLRADSSPQATEATATELCVLTPEYASPEQVRGETITTASDVYSLGVLLYELLTGHRPYRFKSRRPDEIARAICEQEPEKPSTVVTRVAEAGETDGDVAVRSTPEHVSLMREGTPDRLRRRLLGDLDNIALKALRKGPERRYASVEQLSEDIRRHLEGLPVSARKDTFAYRTQKFVRRHRAGVMAASLILLALVGGAVATLWQARVARAERARAERRFDDVRKLANLFMFDYHDAIATLPGSTPVRQRLVKDALEYLDSLAKEAGDDRSLQRELAAAYMKMGEVQGGIVTSAGGATIAASNLGDTAGAVESFRKALVLYERLAAADPKDAGVRRELGDNYARIGDLHLVLGRPAEAAEYMRKAIANYEELSAADPTSKTLRTNLGRYYQVLADALYTPGGAHLGDIQGALSHHRRALEIDEWLAAAEPTNAQRRQILAANHGNIGSLLSLNGNYAEALEYQRRAAAISEGLVSEFGTNLIYRRELGVQYGNLGKTLLAIGDRTGALEQFRQSVALLEALVAADPTPDARRVSATGYRNLAEGLAANGSRAEALGNFNRAVQILSELMAKDPKNARLNLQQGVNYLKLSTFLSDTGDVAGAIEKARQAAELSGTLTAANPNNSSARQTLASSYAQLGRGYASLAEKAAVPISLKKERWQEARSWYQKSLDIWQDMKAKKKLSGADAGKPAEVTREIEKCNAALGSLPS
jgi:serine/threonine protein kinase/tetratricopeptide (TPR) repeat protein